MNMDMDMVGSTTGFRVYMQNREEEEGKSSYSIHLLERLPSYQLLIPKFPHWGKKLSAASLDSWRE